MAEEAGLGWFERVAGFAAELFGGDDEEGGGGGLSLDIGMGSSSSASQSHSGVSLPTADAGPVRRPGGSPVSVSSAQPATPSIAPQRAPTPQFEMPTPSTPGPSPGGGERRPPGRPTSIHLPLSRR